VRLQLIAIQAHETLPIDVLGNRRRLVKRRPALLICHFEKEQERQLLDVVSVRQSVIPENVAVVPEFLNKLMRLVGHVENATIKSDLI